MALYVLDLAQNSVVAGAKHITIDITADVKADHLLIRIVDDGKGMSPHLVERVTDPFFTSRKERRFGLGIPFFKDLVEQCGGTLTIESKEGEGTTIEGKLKLSSVDLVPLGDMGSTIVSLLVSNPELNLVYRFTLNDYSFTFDSAQIREVLQGVNITEPSVLNWIKDYVNEGSIEILPNINISKKEGAKKDYEAD